MTLHEDEQAAVRAAIFFELGTAAGELLRDGVDVISINQLTEIVQGKSWESVKADTWATKQQLARTLRVGMDCRVQRSVCPGCHLDCNTVGLPSLLYTFESCDCAAFPYAHLVEQLWHRGCYEKRVP